MGQGVPVEAEQRLCVDVAGNQVRLVENAARGVSRLALGIAEQEILVCVGVRADVALEVPPRKWRDHDADVRDDAALLGIDRVLGDVVVRIIDFRRRRQAGQPAPEAGWREVVLGVVILRPEHEADEWTDFSLVHLIVVAIGIRHREIGAQPRLDLRLGGSRHIDSVIPRIRDHSGLVVDRRGQPVIDGVVGRRPAEGQVVRLRCPRPQEPADIVIEPRAGRIRSAKEIERGEAASDEGRRTIDTLQLRLGAGRLDPEAVAILPAAAGFPTLGRDEDGAVRRIDAVEGRSFGSLQHGECLDILRIQVGGAVGEVHPAVRKRRVRAQIGGEYPRIERPVVHRQPIDDDERLVTAADGADAANGDRCGRARNARGAGHVHAGDTALQRVDEILPLRLRDFDAWDALLRVS